MKAKFLLLYCCIISFLQSMKVPSSPDSLIEQATRVFVIENILQHHQQPYFCEQYAKEKPLGLASCIPLVALSCALKKTCPLSDKHQKQLALTFLENSQYTTQEKMLPEIITLTQDLNDLDLFQAATKQNIYIPLTPNLAHKILEKAPLQEFIEKGDLQIILPRKNIENNEDINLFIEVLDKNLAKHVQKMDEEVTNFDNKNFFSNLFLSLCPFKRLPASNRLLSLINYSRNFPLKEFSLEEKLYLYTLSTALISASSLSLMITSPQLFMQSAYYNLFNSEEKKKINRTFDTAFWSSVICILKPMLYCCLGELLSDKLK
jgi:hypothetical protein